MQVFVFRILSPNGMAVIRNRSVLIMIIIEQFEDLAEGEYRVHGVGERSWVVARVDGELVAFLNQCGHIPQRMDGARLEGGRFKCPHHGVTYDITSGDVIYDGGFNDVEPLKVSFCEVRDGDLHFLDEPGQKRTEILYTREEVQQAVMRIAREIRSDYKGRNPLMVGILKGSFVFLADLVRLMKMPVEIDFVILSSYGSEKESSGEVKQVLGLQQSIEGRDVIVVEDIVDTGITLNHFMEDLRSRDPASLKLCVLVDKRARREIDIPMDYVGVQVDDEFVVGYGIDFNEQYRYLPEIHAVRED